MRSPGARIKAYIDTNIYVYAILHHPVYGEVCSNIIRDIGRGLYEAHGSHMVAIELLGSLSRIDPSLARKAVELYLSSRHVVIHELSEDVIHLASIINELTNVRYDSVHAAVMLLNSIQVVISNDRDDWLRLLSKYDAIKEKVGRETYVKLPEVLSLVTPNEYREWVKNLTSAAGG